MRVLQETPKKTSGYYGNYMRVLQEMLKNPTKTIDPYAGIATNDSSTTICGPYASITRDAKNTSGYYGT
jgi:hypothetical protein